MSIITYPLNGVTYGAEDVSTYLCTRTSGVYSRDSNFSASITGARGITISPGLAWINYDDFKGVSVCSREDTILTVPAADSTLDRIDRIVLQFDTDANATVCKLKPGTPAAAPAAPAILQNHRQYELGLCTIRVRAGSAAIAASDLTDTRLDEELCGIMRDGVTGIPTADLLAQAKASIAGFEETASASATAAQQSEQNAAASKTDAADSASTATAKASEAATSAEQAASSASAAEQSKTAAAGSATTAAAKASEASTSAGLAAGSADAAAESERVAKEYMDQVKTIATGAQGWYITPDALKSAVPIGADGWWAVIGSTDTIWTWDSDTDAWVDTNKETDFSDFYSIQQMDEKLAGKSNTGHTHLYAGSSSAGGTANSVNGYTITASTVDPGVGGSLASGTILLVYE